jgi:hypothetical protein
VLRAVRPPNAALPFLPFAPTTHLFVSVTAATITSLFVLLGSMTVGVFFLPTAVALIVAAVGPGKQPDPAT